VLSRAAGGDYRLDIFRELDEDVRVSFFPAGEEAGSIEEWVEDLQIVAPVAVAFIGPHNALRSLAALSPRWLRYKGQDLLSEREPEPYFEKEW